MSTISINHHYLVRIANYSSSHYPAESLTLELFNTTFGTVMGKHYYEKWEHTYKCDILKMVAYFGRDTKEGQRFGRMLEMQIEKYEERVGI